MSFSSVGQVAAAPTLIASWRKVPTQTTGAGIWFDLSMSPGNPVPNYYIGSTAVFTPLRQSTDGGLRHGGAVSPSQKVLRELMAMTVTATAVPLHMKLCDYLGFYGFIDESVTDEQPLDNSLSITRCTDGKGVQMMAVVVAGQTGGQDFYVTYTNSDGVAGRVSPTVRMTTQAVNGTILSSLPAGAGGYAGPFLPLQAGDSGVRSVQSVQVLGVGDVGLFALVLVKPLANISIRGIDAPTEVDYLTDFAALPVIADDAYLSFVCLPSGNLAAAQILGTIETNWN